MEKKKKYIIVSSSVAAVILIIAIVAMALLIPRTGKGNDYVWSYGDEYDFTEIAQIEKDAGKELKIMLVTDIQLWSNAKDNKAALNMVKEMAESQKPDLIVTLGDNVSGLTTDSLTKQFIGVMEEIGIPWAPIYGNHDAEGNATLDWQGDRYEEAEHCLFSKGPANLYGSGNYVINVVENGKAVKSLFMFDNGRYYNYPGIGNKEIWMGYEQIAWYEWNVLGLAKKEKAIVPSMTFSHFSAPEFREAFEFYNIEQGTDNLYKVPEELGFGYCQYLPGVAPVNSGFFDKAKNYGTTHMFFGHDHENNASITYEDMVMTYGLKTGPSPKPWNSAIEYGVTMVTIGNADSEYAISVKHVEHSKA